MIIVKVGGSALINKSRIAEDVKTCKQKLIFVHGGRAQTNDIAKKMGVPTKTITSPTGMTSIFTDRQALDLLIMSYSGLENTRWVSEFQKLGVNAVGLTGVDGKIWLGEKKEHIIAVENNKKKLISNTFTGKVYKVDTKLLNVLIENGYQPVLTQPAITHDGQPINTDNDRNIAVMAKALLVTTLVILFEAPGLLKDFRDPKSIIKHVNKNQLNQAMQYAQGTMKKKVLGAIEAFDNGVKTIYWGDSRIDHPISSALQGNGTKIQ